MIAQLFGTFGLMLFIRYVALFFWGPNFRTVSKGWFIGKSTVMGDVIVFDLAKVAPAVISIIAFLAVSYLINRTRIGKALKATALDKEAAGYMGIHTERMNALAWAIGGGTVGLAGALLVNFWYVTPEVGLLFVMIAFATVALGGFGSLKGAFIGAVIIELFTYGSSEWKKAVRSGWGNFLGRVAGMITKMAIAIGMIVWISFAVLP